mgnify:CR=1 FL=1
MIACLLFMKRVGESSRISVLTDEIDLHSGTDITPADEVEHLTIPQGVEVYEINGPYFFGVANQFEELMARWATVRVCASSVCARYLLSIPPAFTTSPTCVR